MSPLAQPAPSVVSACRKSSHGALPVAAPAASCPPRPAGALAALITELVMLAREEPASEEAMELNFLLLEQRRLEDELAAAAERGDYERRAKLSRERAELVQQIAHAQRVGS